MELLDPAPDFSAPLAALSACHRRLVARLEILLRLGAHLPTHGADEDARKAAASVLTYFQHSARNHHRDEEDSLFPRLLREARTDSQREQAFDLVSRLMVDHLSFEGRWQQIEAQLQSVTRGEVPLFDILDWRCFVKGYLHHIDLEEERLFPLASLLLGTDALDQIGTEMELRRIHGAR